MPPVTLKYSLGPDIEYPRPKRLEEGRNTGFMDSGSALIGEKASIMAGSHSQGGRIFPEAFMKETSKPPQVAHRCEAADQDLFMRRLAPRDDIGWI